MTETRTTILDFIKHHGINSTAQRTSSNPSMDRDMDHWKVRLTRSFTGVAQYADRNGKAAPRRYTLSMTVPFSMGYGHHGKEPEAADVLSCLASDAANVNMSSFEDWRSDLGYDTDSRKAERTYKTCEKQADKLKRFLGQDAYDELLYHTEPL